MMENFKEILNYRIFETSDYSFTLATVFIIVVIFFGTKVLLFGVRRVLNRIFERRGIDRGR
ncbi:MAG: hypothetical protein RIF39_07215, partial [Cyclobacteriaceae bacterium]